MYSSSWREQFYTPGNVSDSRNEPWIQKRSIHAWQKEQAKNKTLAIVYRRYGTKENNIFINKMYRNMCTWKLLPFGK